jgi:hypothetical protein
MRGATHQVLNSHRGIAAGKGVAILCRKGEVVRRVKEADIVSAVLEEVEKFQVES